MKPATVLRGLAPRRSSGGRGVERAWLDSLVGRLTLVMTGLVLVVAISMTTVSALRTEQLARQELEQSAHLLAHAMAVTSMDALYRGDADQLGEALETLQTNDVVLHGRFFDDRGRVVSDTADPKARFVLEPDEAGARLVASTDTPRAEWRGPAVVVSQPIDVGRRRIGGVELTLSGQAVGALVEAARFNGIVAGLVALITGGVLARLIAESITRPVRELTAAAVQIAEGS